jgi:predicted regulator of Ras-like GTPase activity (Roadblock/LC7/MglB family)
MSLQGTLDDFGIVELLQIPYHGKKTCNLVLTGERGKAILYYDKGQIVHAQFQDKTGMKVVEEIIDWDRGSFEIGQDIQPTERTINKDLHTLLLLVVKTRDESVSAQSREQKKGENLTTWLTLQLEAFCKSSGSTVYLSIMDKSGIIIARAQDVARTQALVTELEQFVSDVVKMYPRAAFAKATFEDGSGIVSAMRITDSWILLAVSERDCPLGAISLGLNRLVTQIAQKVEAEANG